MWERKQLQQKCKRAEYKMQKTEYVRKLERESLREINLRRPKEPAFGNGRYYWEKDIKEWRVEKARWKKKKDERDKWFSKSFDRYYSRVLSVPQPDWCSEIEESDESTEESDEDYTEESDEDYTEESDDSDDSEMLWFVLKYSDLKEEQIWDEKKALEIIAEKVLMHEDLYVFLSFSQRGADLLLTFKVGGPVNEVSPELLQEGAFRTRWEEAVVEAHVLDNVLCIGGQDIQPNCMHSGEAPDAEYKSIFWSQEVLLEAVNNGNLETFQYLSKFFEYDADVNEHDAQYWTMALNKMLLKRDYYMFEFFVKFAVDKFEKTWDEIFLFQDLEFVNLNRMDDLTPVRLLYSELEHPKVDDHINHYGYVALTEDLERNDSDDSPDKSLERNYKDRRQLLWVVQGGLVEALEFFLEQKLLILSVADKNDEISDETSEGHCKIKRTREFEPCSSFARLEGFVDEISPSNWGSTWMISDTFFATDAIIHASSRHHGSVEMFQKLWKMVENWKNSCHLLRFLAYDRETDLTILTFVVDLLQEQDSWLSFEGFLYVGQDLDLERWKILYPLVRWPKAEEILEYARQHENAEFMKMVIDRLMQEDRRNSPWEDFFTYMWDEMEVLQYLFAVKANPLGKKPFQYITSAESIEAMVHYGCEITHLDTFSRCIHRIWGSEVSTNVLEKILTSMNKRKGTTFVVVLDRLIMLKRKHYQFVYGFKGFREDTKSYEHWEKSYKSDQWNHARKWDDEFDEEYRDETEGIPGVVRMSCDDENTADEAENIFRNNMKESKGLPNAKYPLDTFRIIRWERRRDLILNVELLTDFVDNTELRCAALALPYTQMDNTTTVEFVGLIKALLRQTAIDVSRVLGFVHELIELEWARDLLDNWSVLRRLRGQLTDCPQVVVQALLSRSSYDSIPQQPYFLPTSRYLEIATARFLTVRREKKARVLAELRTDGALLLWTVPKRDEVVRYFPRRMLRDVPYEKRKGTMYCEIVTTKPERTLLEFETEKDADVAFDTLRAWFFNTPGQTSI